MIPRFKFILVQDKPQCLLVQSFRYEREELYIHVGNNVILQICQRLMYFKLGFSNCYTLYRSLHQSIAGHGYYAYTYGQIVNINRNFNAFFSHSFTNKSVHTFHVKFIIIFCCKLTRLQSLRFLIYFAWAVTKAPLVTLLT